MLRKCSAVATICMRGARSNLQWPIKSKNVSLTYASLVTTRQSLEIQNSELDNHVRNKSRDVSSLIESGANTDSPVKAYEVIQILSDWVGENLVNFNEDIEKDVNYKRLLSLIERESGSTSPMVILNGLKNLRKMGCKDDAYVIQCAENNLLWNIRKISIPILLSIFLYQVQNQTTPLKRKVLKETTETIQRRWVEIKGAKEIQLVYTHHEIFGLDFIGKLDDRTIELAEDMTYQDLSGIVCALATGKRRATPVLRSLAFHMAKQDDKLPPKQLSNLLYAMHMLSFPDQVLLEKIGKDLIPQVSSIDNPSIIGAILFCMGQMRWRQTSLLEVITDWIENNIDECRISDLVSVVLTLASVAYTPTNAESLFPKLISKLNINSVTRETVWLDVVWSLTLLGRATNDLIASILDPAFVSKTKSVAQYLHLGVKLKLLNINAASKCILSSYDGPQLDLSYFQDLIITQSRNELMLSKHVQKMLYNFLPPPKYIRENIQTPMGIFVDCELAVDQKGKPIPILEYSSAFGESNSTKPLPEGASKLVLFVWDYKDYTLGTQELTGVNQFAVQLMNKIGYKVVQVPYFEYNMRGKAIKNIQYLESKIKEAVGV